MDIPEYGKADDGFPCLKVKPGDTPLTWAFRRVRHEGQVSLAPLIPVLLDLDMGTLLQGLLPPKDLRRGALTLNSDLWREEEGFFYFYV